MSDLNELWKAVLLIGAGIIALAGGYVTIMNAKEKYQKNSAISTLQNTVEKHKQAFQRDFERLNKIEVKLENHDKAIASLGDTQAEDRYITLKTMQVLLDEKRGVATEEQINRLSEELDEYLLKFTGKKLG